MKIRLTKEQFDYVIENYFSPHGIKNVVYEKMEEKAFYELSEVANKSEQDFKDSPGCYFDDKKLKEKALEIKNRLNAYGYETETKFEKRRKFLLF